jgi:hypothetical protein
VSNNPYRPEPCHACEERRLATEMTTRQLQVAAKVISVMTAVILAIGFGWYRYLGYLEQKGKIESQRILGSGYQTKLNGDIIQQIPTERTEGGFIWVDSGIVTVQSITGPSGWYAGWCDAGARLPYTHCAVPRGAEGTHCPESLANSRKGPIE